MRKMTVNGIHCHFLLYNLYRFQIKAALYPGKERINFMPLPSAKAEEFFLSFTGSHPNLSKTFTKYNIRYFDMKSV